MHNKNKTFHLQKLENFRQILHDTAAANLVLTLLSCVYIIDQNYFLQLLNLNFPQLPVPHPNVLKIGPQTNPIADSEYQQQMGKIISTGAKYQLEASSANPIRSSP